MIGLCALRQRGLIHRDMKPANLLMGQNGHLLISDLGLAFACPTHMSDLEKSLLTPFVLARREAHASEVTTGMCGTPLYTSPEMILRQPYSYAVDVWAFGVILFQMLIGGVSTSISIFQRLTHSPIVTVSFLLSHWKRKVCLGPCHSFWGF